MSLAQECGLTATTELREVGSRGLDGVVLSLDKPAAVRDVVLGMPLGLATRAPLVVIDVGTTGPSETMVLQAALAEAGHVFVDSPVSGGARGAELGQLTAMVGAGDGDIAGLGGILAAFCAQVEYMGATGYGALAKLANNAMAISCLALVSEVLALAEAAGLDRQRVLDVLAASSGDTRMVRQRTEMILNSTFSPPSFDARLAQKDMTLFVSEAKSRKLSVPMIELVTEAVSAVADRSPVAVDVAAVTDRAYAESETPEGDVSDSVACLSRSMRKSRPA